MYTVLSILFLFLVRREIEHGPEPVVPPQLREQIDAARLNPVEVR
jgi:hypothetical protein